MDSIAAADVGCHRGNCRSRLQMLALLQSDDSDVFAVAAAAVAAEAAASAVDATDESAITTLQELI